MSASRTIKTLLLSKNGIKNLVKCNRNKWGLANFVQVDGLSSIACVNHFLLGNQSSFGAKKRHLCLSECDYGGIRKRGLLGCGDGAEGNVLAKVYEERRVLGSVISSFVDFWFYDLCWFSVILISWYGLVFL